MALRIPSSAVGVDLGGGRVALAAREGVGVLAREGDLLVFLAVLEGDGDRELGLVEPGGGLGVGEGGRAGARQAVSSASTFAASAALAAGAICFQVSLPLSFSNAVVCPLRMISTRVVLNARASNRSFTRKSSAGFFSSSSSADSTVNTIGRERSFA